MHRSCRIWSPYSYRRHAHISAAIPGWWPDIYLHVSGPSPIDAITSPTRHCSRAVVTSASRGLPGGCRLAAAPPCRSFRGGCAAHAERTLDACTRSNTAIGPGAGDSEYQGLLTLGMPCASYGAVCSASRARQTWANGVMLRTRAPEGGRGQMRSTIAREARRRRCGTPLGQARLDVDVPVSPAWPGQAAEG